jgi:hypothetical protein
MEPRRKLMMARLASLALQVLDAAHPRSTPPHLNSLTPADANLSRCALKKGIESLHKQASRTANCRSFLMDVQLADSTGFVAHDRAFFGPAPNRALLCSRDNAIPCTLRFRR